MSQFVKLVDDDLVIATAILEGIQYLIRNASTKSLWCLHMPSVRSRYNDAICIDIINAYIYLLLIICNSLIWQYGMSTLHINFQLEFPTCVGILVKWHYAFTALLRNRVSMYLINVVPNALFLYWLNLQKTDAL